MIIVQRVDILSTVLPRIHHNFSIFCLNVSLNTNRNTVSPTATDVSGSNR